ncbi:putative NADH-ubiquinone oxidoreductase 14 kDa subunit [Venturia nashicola]|uniref:NADH-ubiquinone oxidoreductase 14 kDa subunit n=2 Tax=Venturia TaxID=5024 RepID=A0A517LP47_9PEZI|nr:hypothetical protein FKW77_006602 [Venturia effusa]TID18979.1 putative NADH-ubiquinone oxidoreductase 14 kDa subunit [Venturia nashicola]TLD29661.1 putative NADH-ubiquinone oxidoreductase 14 kDa subunit [Venturia nashicola]
MVSKVLFWGGFGVAVRLWQLGLEMRPLFNKTSLWAYPVYAAIGGSFGFWMQGVDTSQMKAIAERKGRLIEKRLRRAQREGTQTADA